MTVAPGPDPHPLDDPMLRGSRALALASLLGLIVLGLAWELWLAPTGTGTLALKVPPLFGALPGLWLGRLYYRWPRACCCGCISPKAWCVPSPTRACRPRLPRCRCC